MSQIITLKQQQELDFLKLNHNDIFYINCMIDTIYLKFPLEIKANEFKLIGIDIAGTYRLEECCGIFSKDKVWYRSGSKIITRRQASKLLMFRKFL